MPQADVLVHAGDWSMMGREKELISFCDWIKKQRKVFSHCLITAGNHDWCAQREFYHTKDMIHEAGGKLLIDEITYIGNKSFYFSPWTPEFFDWAFMKPEKELYKVFSKIPNGLDVLVTHGPPYGILDKNIDGEHCGSHALLDSLGSRINEIFVPPKYHIFGHIHEGYGKEVRGSTKYSTEFINASICNLKYKPVNLPVVIEI